MTKVKVRIDMDEVWSWSISVRMQMRRDHAETMEIDEALLDEYNVLSDQWYNLQDRLEQLYRAQEGLKPWIAPEIPEHVRLTGDENGT